MAPRFMSATVPIQAPEYNPVLLTGRQRLLCALGLVVSLAGIAMGVLGLLVLMDVEAQKAWYSKTQFAELWTWLTSKNPMLTAMVVNGSLVVLIISIGYLRDDRNARKAAAEKKED